MIKLKISVMLFKTILLIQSKNLKDQDIFPKVQLKITDS